MSRSCGQKRNMNKLMRCIVFAVRKKQHVRLRILTTIGIQYLCPYSDRSTLCNNVYGGILCVKSSPVLSLSSALTLHRSFTVALVCYVVASPISAFICYRFKMLRSLVVVGYTLFLVWAICMATISLDGHAAIYGYQAFLGTALALVLNAVVASAQLSAPPELMYVRAKYWQTCHD